MTKSYVTNNTTQSRDKGTTSLLARVWRRWHHSHEEHRIMIHAIEATGDGVGVC